MAYAYPGLGQGHSPKFGCSLDWKPTHKNEQQGQGIEKKVKEAGDCKEIQNVKAHVHG